MEGCLVQVVRTLRHFSDSEITQTLQEESPRLEVTKSLLSLLYNICLVKSVAIAERHKADFRSYDSLVLHLLEGSSLQVNQTTRLQDKKRILQDNPDFVRLLSESCP